MKLLYVLTLCSTCSMKSMVPPVPGAIPLLPAARTLTIIHLVPERDSRYIRILSSRSAIVCKTLGSHKRGQ